MIGTDLNLVLPSLSESMATNISRIATALSQIEDSIAQKATPAALDINAPLDMQGNALTNTTSVQLLPGNVPSTAGSIYYYNGEFYLIDGTGTIQLTANGALNAASVGGIGGDYGGVNPAAVVFDDASGEYRFTEDNTPTWADLKAQDVILMQNGGTGYVRLGVDAAITAGRTFYFKSLPSSGASMLVYNASTSTLEDGAATRATGTQLFTAIDATSTVKGADFKHSDVEMPLSHIGHSEFANGGSAVQRPHQAWRSTGSGTWTFMQHLPLKVGDRVKSVTVRLAKTSTVLARIYIYKWDGTTLTQVATNTTASSSTVELTATVGTPVAIVSGEHWYVQVEWSDGHTMDKLRATFDRP
jgi:hypothetical protein